MKKGIVKDAVMGVAVADALGVPVEFCSRSARDIKPVDGMWEYGTYNMPKGTWSDDSSMTLATVDAFAKVIGEGEENLTNRLLEKMTDNFVDWFKNSAFTPDGKLFDIGNATAEALGKYIRNKDVYACGGTSVYGNGNGSLMRIIPACLYCAKLEQEGKLSTEAAIAFIHLVSAITHAHIRSEIACGLYYFIVKELLGATGPLMEDGMQEEMQEKQVASGNRDGSFTDEKLMKMVQTGLQNGFEFYEKHLEDLSELALYDRLRNVEEFCKLHRDLIKSSGYVIDTLEASIWCLLTTKDYPTAVLKAVNLGSDTDTVAAVTGGLAGLYYGYNGIPKIWLEELRQREYIEELCEAMESKL